MIVDYGTYFEKSEFSWCGRVLVSKLGPLRFDYSFEDGLYLTEDASLSVFAYGSSFAEMIFELCEEMFFCWDAFAHEKWAEISLEAKKVGSHYLEVFDEI